ncbi:MAG TPA: 50S ribosomal protein L31 [Candidatus Pacearchaeota archaeon]|jgi:large subunit ribosomal protein L31|nr:MAG: 50S ribosomal protein L31 [Parcubacteria bacterium 34_609]KUK98300.1 MAG: 50S ribosomal protein L31 [Parcubacteria bacterium 32_520]NMB40132.1 50S ribosomal protein L31 [Parcubacteria group bacterium]HOF44990.1 50S ribosomal protein L31 [Candidatus Pacearchaeota archaeon]HRT18338.1 50S ribosomal protein L31 [Candidatus Paceibacterota bacterium]
MKKEIHPKYFDNAKISCVCGAMFEVGSTVENMEVEICSQCHPFYTGKERGSDKVGRVQKFKERAAKKKK